mgnify:CR=1 FL=1
MLAPCHALSEEGRAQVALWGAWRLGRGRFQRPMLTLFQTTWLVSLFSLALGTACTSEDDEETEETEESEQPETYGFVKQLNFSTGSDMVALPSGHIIVSDMGSRTLFLVDPEVPAIRTQIQYPDGYPAMLSLELDPRFGEGVGDTDFLYTYGGGGAVTRYLLGLNPFSLSEEVELFDPGCETNEMSCYGDLVWWDGEAGEPILYVLTTQGTLTDHQDGGNLGSKLLAMQVDTETGAAIPAFSSGFENDYVVATGLRNPWRLTPCGAVLCVVDPGNRESEELNLYDGAGMNFGWPFVEGYGNEEEVAVYDDPAFAWENEDPTWPQSDPTGPGIVGIANAPALGVRVSGEAYEGWLEGVVLFGDFFDGWVRGLPLDDAGSVVGASMHVAHQSFLMSMVEVGGFVYALDMAGGFYRLVPWKDRPIIAAERLSDTHFADSTPYDLRYPSWSNGAVKERSLWLPSGSTIDTSAEDWVYPEGTQIFKSFLVGGEPVETRLISLVDGRWLGTVFLWEGSEAYRYNGQRQDVVAADGSNYVVPGETSCSDCHDSERGREWPLGLEPYVLGDDGLSQIANSLDREPDAAPHGEGTQLDLDARGYLHSNCAYCHSAEGVAGGFGSMPFDLSYNADLNLDGRVSAYIDSDLSSDFIVNPDVPEESVLTRVMESAQMPYVGIWEPDEEGIALLHEWIATQ